MKLTLLTKILIIFSLLAFVAWFINPTISFWMVVLEIVAFLFLYATHKFVMGSFYLFMPAGLILIFTLLILVFTGSSNNETRYIVSAKVEGYTHLNLFENEKDDRMGFNVVYKDVNGNPDSYNLPFEGNTDKVKDGDNIVIILNFDMPGDYTLVERPTEYQLEKFQNGMVFVGEFPGFEKIEENFELRWKYSNFIKHNAFWLFINDNKWPVIIFLFVMLFIVHAIGDRLSICSILGISVFVILWIREFTLSSHMALATSALYYCFVPLVRMFMSGYRQKKEFLKYGGYVASTQITSSNNLCEAKFLDPWGNQRKVYLAKETPKGPALIAHPYPCSNNYFVLVSQPSQELINKYAKGLFLVPEANIEAAEDDPYMRNDFNTYKIHWIKEKN